MRRISRLLISTIACVLICCGAASAQYVPIPNYTGINAGALLRQAINNRFSGVQPISPQMVHYAFASLPAEVNGDLLYCDNCSKTIPCTGGGSGAFAFGQAGAWGCAAGSGVVTLTGDASGPSGATVVNTVKSGKTPVDTTQGLNALATASGTYNMGANRLTNLGQATTNGDALGWGQNGNVNSLAANGITGTGTAPTVGGLSVNGQFNVLAYGALGNGSNCDEVPIQAAIEAACAVSPAQVYFPRPASYYKVCAPIFIDCNNLRLTGDTYQGTGNTGLRRGDFLTNIKASFSGPIFVLKNGGAGIDLDTPLITNSVHSAKFDYTTEIYYVNLNDVPSTIAGPMTINGLSAVTIQAYVKFSAIDANVAILSSAGARYAGASSTRAYSIKIVSSQFQAALTVNGVATSVITDSVDTPTAGVLYHFALVLDPNAGSSVLRFFVNGVDRGTVAYGAAKTAVQNNWETAAIGGQNNSFYTEDDREGNWECHCSIDGVEIANIARYTAPFTPSYAEPVADSHTLVKASFDVNDRSLTQVQFAGSSNQWIPVRRITEPSGGVVSTSAIEMDHLSLKGFSGSVGIFANQILLCNFHDLSLGSMYEGINIWGTSFENRFDNIWVSAAGANGYYGIKDDGGIDYFGFGRVDGFPFQFVGRGGSYVLNNFFTQGEADTIWTYIFTNAGNASNTGNVVCTQCESDQENSGTVYQGTFFLNGVGTVKLIGGSAVSSSTTTPAIQIAKVGTGSIDGMGFTAIAGAPPELIHVLAGNVIAPLQLINPDQFGGTVPWSDSAVDVTVQTGAAIAIGPKDKGTVTTNTSFTAWQQYPVQQASTATTALTYTLDPAGLNAGTQITLISKITGSITGPLWATSSGAFMWAGGTAPVSSTTSGYTDIIKLLWDGTNWQEISRSLGNH